MKWEYEVVEIQVAKDGFVVKPELEITGFRQKLNELGSAGWELVSIFDVNMLQSGSKPVVATFKRPVPAEPAATTPPPPVTEAPPVPPPLPQN